MNGSVLRVAAKAFIRNHGRFLLLREGAADGTQIGKYQIPGGMIEPGESYMEGLLREVKEETGLSVRPIIPIMVDGWMPTIEGVKHQIVAIFYLCDTDSEDVKLSHEHNDFVWVSPAELSSYEVPHPVPKLFAKYQELSGQNWGEL
jgi:8-oxo-dGTP diphosphatase